MKYFFLQGSSHPLHKCLETPEVKINLFLLLGPSSRFFVLPSQSLSRGGSSNLIPLQQVCTGTEPSSGHVWNQRKWSQQFQSQGNNGNPTGGTAGNALALFPPAVICRCLLTTHDAANEHCFLCLRGRELPICLSRKYVSQWKLHFISSWRGV